MVHEFIEKHRTLEFLRISSMGISKPYIDYTDLDTAVEIWLITSARKELSCSGTEQHSSQRL